MFTWHSCTWQVLTRHAAGSQAVLWCSAAVGRQLIIRCHGPLCRFDYSEWVRSYARYLDEQLEVYAKIAFYQVRF